MAKKIYEPWELRKIEPWMLKYILDKMAKVPAHQAAIKAKDFRQIFVGACDVLVGIREKTGKNDGKFIEGIQETYGGHSGEPYCNAGMQTGLAVAEHVTGLHSPVFASELAQDIWNRTPKSQRVKKIPLPGAIAVWADVNTKTKKRKTTGHCEAVRAADENRWYGIGFNTSGSTYPGGPVVREGNGVYYTNRDYKDRAGRILLGFVKPI